MKEYSDDLPWNEARWEEFITRSELRAAKYGELLETLRDHPQRDSLIAQDMGWMNAPRREDGASDVEPDEGQIDLDAVFEGEISEEELREAAEYSRAKREALQALPSYRAAYNFGFELHQALIPFVEKLDHESVNPRETDAALMTAFCDSLVIAAKLAGAYGMGYDEQTLCGSIVICNKALRAAQNCHEALCQLLTRNDSLPVKTLQAFVEHNKQVIALIEEHIESLRERVWWE